MLIDHSELLLQPARLSAVQHGTAFYQTAQQPITCPKLAGLNMRVGCIWSQKQYCLEWGSPGGTLKAFEPLQISGGTITISPSPDKLVPFWTITCAPGNFPGTPRGTLYSPEFSSIAATPYITIQLHGMEEKPKEASDLIASHFASSSIFSRSIDIR